MISRHTRAFSLTEVLFSLALLAVFGVIAAEVFHNVFGLFNQTQAAQSRISAYESAANALRKDVWSASRIDLPDSAHAQLAYRDGRSITWAIDEAGEILRSETAGDTNHWDANIPKLRFKQEPAALLLADPAADSALAVRFTSQVILAGGVP